MFALVLFNEALVSSRNRFGKTMSSCLCCHSCEVNLMLPFRTILGPPFTSVEHRVCLNPVAATMSASLRGSYMATGY